MKRSRTVDEYIDGAEQWQEELQMLRKILLAAPFTETVKWGAPCYTVDGKNVVGLAAFKEYVGLWFHQGALLSDPEGHLINAQPGKTKALRQWRFASKREIKPRLIKSYVLEAIALQKQGKGIKPERSKQVELPAELRGVFAANRRAKQAFAKLTPGRRREYAEYVAEAKRESTRQARIKKILPMILAGHGLNDRYRC